MKYGKKSLLIVIMTCLLALSFVMPAAAAEVPDENYEVTASQIVGDGMKTITRVLEDKPVTEEVVINYVGKGAVVFFTAKKDTGAMLIGYRTENGVQNSEAIPWENAGIAQYDYMIKTGLTVSVPFPEGYDFFEVAVWDDNKNSSSYFFKLQEGSAPFDLPDAWAKPEVDAAIGERLIPEQLQSKYKEKITRADFATLIIKLIEVKTGQTIDEILQENELNLNDNPFTDTKAKEIIAANKLGIVNGKGSGKFDPNGSITRQEAASMLTKTAIALGYDVKADVSAYADNDIIAAWASAGVNFVSEFGIMKGTGNNQFSPKGSYTRQQAYMTMWRLYNALE